MVELRELCLDDGEAVLAMLREIGPGENGYGNAGHDIEFAEFQKYLQARIDMSNGVGYDPSLFVPQTQYFLYVDGHPVGVGKLRHHLNDRLMVNGGHIGYTIRPSERRKGYGTMLLAELLKKARALSIPEVLLTCAANNVASRIVIEANGGVLECEPTSSCRYWIRLDQ